MTLPFGNALDGRRDQLALAIHIFAIDVLALDFFDALQNDLLGRLRRDPAEVVRRALDHHRFAELDIGLDALRIDIINLEAIVEHLVDHLLLGETRAPCRSAGQA